MLAPVQNTRRISLSLMVIGNYNPRRRSGLQQWSLEALAESIKAHGGFIQMPLLRPITVDGAELYEVIAGGRRIRAARIAYGPDAEVVVDVREMTTLEAIAASAAENIDRENMSPAEEAEAAARVLAELDGDREATAKQMGWTVPVLNDRLKLMACSDLVRDRLADRELSLGVAELLAGLPKAKQDELIAGFDAQGRVPTVDEFKTQVMILTKSLDGAIFDKADCASCQFNSTQQSALFANGIEVGHCLNAPCYDEKTEAALIAKADSLRDTYQTVRIVRSGEQFRIQKLSADGPHGVGEEQATACRSCADFGVAVSGVPDKLGRVSGSLCFNVKCNEDKVRARQAAETEAAAAVKAAAAALKQASAEVALAESTSSPDGLKKPGKTKPGAAPAPKAAVAVKAKPTPSVTLSAAVIDYRDRLYATVVATEVLKSPARGFGLLMALACQSRLGAISSEQAVMVTKKLMPGERVSSLTSNLGERYLDVLSCPEDRVAHFASRIAATAASTLHREELVAMVKATDPDWTEHFTLGEDFLSLLTKSEIQAVAEELGLDTALGTANKGLYVKKKDEILKAVLGIKDFAYRGAVPRMLKPGFGSQRK